MKLYVGTIDWFGSDGYGFIHQDDTPPPPLWRVYCHVNAACYLRAGVKEPEFDYSRPLQMIPAKGDRVVYQLVFGMRGWSAGAWNFFTQFETVQEEIDGRPIYRVLRYGMRDGEMVGTAEVVWEGWDLEYLQAKYPRPDTQVEDPKSDQIRRLIYHSSRHETHHCWEVRSSTSDWKPCEDPRKIHRVNGRMDGLFVRVNRSKISGFERIPQNGGKPAHEQIARVARFLPV